MDTNLLSIPFQPAYEMVVKNLKIQEDLEEEFREVYDACIAVARPKAVFTLVDVSHAENATLVGSQPFESRIMAVNMAKVNRAFPYAVTCGRELFELSEKSSDPLEKWWIDGISQLAMMAVSKELVSTLTQRYHLGKTAQMNPGSLEDFPLTCQKELFQLLGEGVGKIGVELTESCLMLPQKSVAGILYETEADFENCMLCPREHCPTRRAKFNPDIAQQTYHLS